MRLALALVLFLLSGCSPEPQNCTPGHSTSCSCRDGSLSSATCQTTPGGGSDWSACGCTCNPTCPPGLYCDRAVCRPQFAHCTACGSGSSCDAWSTCVQRPCDGRWGCLPQNGEVSCSTVDGELCPEVSAYHHCASHSQCGVHADCVPIESGWLATCLLECNVPGACPLPSGSVMVSATCTDQHHCILECEVGRSVCPGGLQCFPRQTGSVLGACG